MPKPAPGPRAGSAEMPPRSGAGRASAGAGRDGHSPAALPGTIQEAADAQGGFITGLSHVPRLAWQSVPPRLPAGRGAEGLTGTASHAAPGAR